MLHSLGVLACLSLSPHANASSFILNNPYPPAQSEQNIYYSSFSEQPRTLDPAKSYSANEYMFTQQIYESLLQYDYYQRPYTLVPLVARQIPEREFLDKEGNRIALDQEEAIAYTRYTVSIKAGIFYQPHPAFAKNSAGAYRYYPLPQNFLDRHHINRLQDFKYTGTRELLAEDYIYQIKRLANPANSSPVSGLMRDFIVGFKEFATKVPNNQSRDRFTDLRDYPLQGLRRVDRYTFSITLHGRYSQFVYWLAMPFFTAIPWEVDRFYHQEGMDDKNINLDWYPVGTGPFMLSENNPNRQMILAKNPNFRPLLFPDQGSEDDRRQGYMHSVGKALPLIDKAVFTLEKETIPRWNKFLQGYYDLSGISADSFDQAIRVDAQGHAQLSAELQAKKMRLTQTDEPAIYYMGFNMLDPVVGGSSERARLLRQAISIAVNHDEFIAIFLNGRGRPAQGPIPPGIFGYTEGEAGINPYVYDWQEGQLRRKELSYARTLLKQAGYDGGMNPATGKRLVLHYDVTSSGSPDDKAQLDWMRKQFAKLGIALNIRTTQYNRFQEKMRNGHAQIFSWGWKADYPDPENFLFLLYSQNGKVKYGGENAANYSNSRFDRLFENMRNLENTPQRQRMIAEMIALVRHDAPWIFGVNAQSFVIAQDWLSKSKPNTMVASDLQYLAVDVAERNRLRTLWNRPVVWPLGVFLLIGMLLLIPMWRSYRRKEYQRARRMDV
ncbi:MAG: ABC transporter substrate-binding protein [Legionellaceae bacterium]|nr:ABC transporter substrate-binding protein [Legionellaceae bacterium]